MKNIAIKVCGTCEDPVDLTIEPGVTPTDIFSGLNFSQDKQNFLLLCNSFQQAPFDNNEDIYDKVDDSEKLFIVQACGRLH